MPLPPPPPPHDHRPLPPGHPPKPPHPPTAKPISPPLKSLPYHQPLKENKKKSLITAFLVGSLITIVAGLLLSFFKISVNVILPVLAPVWVGSITLFYSVNSKS